ncbi:unnamed protein product [Caenorhabditis angaria]|uniref:C-type lectin domain-containing protein n=1 Tax=Caenorhabditis angaria TaxID=860376 RepID=A0A9P1IM22_9PELO|nr:unnamed protein product [Caenorhabditis angaria]
MFLSIFLVGFTLACIPTDNSVPILPEETTTTTTTTTPTPEPVLSCPEGWTKFDRTPTPWCMRVALGATTQSTALVTCQALNSAAVISGFQNQNEITTMIAAAQQQGAVPATNLIVGAERKSECDSGITAECTTLTSFYWTDGYTSGTDGFQWLSEQPDGGQFVVILVGSGLMDDGDGVKTRGGVVCGMKAQYL